MVPDGSAFFAVIGKWNAKDVGLWSTATRDGAFQKPTKTYAGFGEIRMEGSAPGQDQLLGAAAVASKNLFAFASKAGEVRVHRSSGAQGTLTQLPGSGPVALVFTADARHLVGIRGGKAYAWALETPER